MLLATYQPRRCEYRDHADCICQKHDEKERLQRALGVKMREVVSGEDDFEHIQDGIEPRKRQMHAARRGLSCTIPAPHRETCVPRELRRT